MKTRDWHYSKESADWICRTCGLVTDHCRCEPLTFASKEARALLARERPDRRPSDKLAYVMSPDQTEKVYLAADELEEYETANEVAFTSDVIEDRSEYDALVRWLSEECLESL